MASSTPPTYPNSRVNTGSPRVFGSSRYCAFWSRVNQYRRAYCERSIGDERQRDALPRSSYLRDAGVTPTHATRAF